MKTKILVGTVAALLWGGVALANDKDCPPGYEKQNVQGMNSQAPSDDRTAVIETQPVDQSTGGSGQAGTTDESLTNEGVGGSGQVGTSSPSNNNEMLLKCQPIHSGTGGSGVDQNSTGSSSSIDQNSQSSTGGSGYQSEPLREPEATPPTNSSQVVVVPPPAPAVSEPNTAFTPAQPVQEKQESRSKKKLRGLSLTVGGGVEGYSGALAPEINPGPAYGVQADIRPSKVLGLELGYSGAVNNLDLRSGSSASSGPDLVRNGGQAALTFGLAATPVQPYVMGGVGFSDYNFRGSSAEFRDDTVGNVPVGAGLRTQIGDFTADLRANYNFLFSQDFAMGVDNNAGNGRYSGTLNIGGTF